MTIYISVFEKSALSPSSLPLLSIFFSPLPTLPPSPGDESEGYLFVPFHYKEEKKKENTASQLGAAYKTATKPTCGAISARSTIKIRTATA